MSARIPPGFAEAWFQFNAPADAENMYCSVGLDLATGVAANQAAADAILVAGTGALRPIVSADLTLGPGHVIFGNDGGDIRIDGTAAPLAGTAATGALPNNTAVLVRKLTASGGRRNRGRMYIPGPPEGSVGPTGVLATAYLTSSTTAINNFMVQVEATAEVESLMLLHDTAPFTPTEITSLEVQVKAATQRRRMRP